MIEVVSFQVAAPVYRPYAGVGSDKHQFAATVRNGEHEMRVEQRSTGCGSFVISIVCSCGSKSGETQSWACNELAHSHKYKNSMEPIHAEGFRAAEAAVEGR